MHKSDMKKWPVLLVAGIMIVGAFVIAVPSAARADGHFLLAQTPIGNYRVDLTLNGNLGPEEVAAMAFMDVDNTASITQYTGPGGAVIIPTTMAYPNLNQGGEIVIEDPPVQNTVRVSGLGDGAFQGRTDITSISIPEGVTYIGAGAFSGCTSLASIYFVGSILPSVSDQWLEGASINLKGYTNKVAGFSPLGTEYHGLMIYKLAQVTLVKPPVSLSGSIVDASGRGVPGALVSVGAANGTTDADGHFLVMAPAGLANVIISGANVKTTTVATYLGSSGTEMGEVPVALAESSSETHSTEAIALMMGVIAIAIVLLIVSMLVAGKHRGKD